MIELVEFTCANCEAPNRLQTEKLLRLTTSPKCGKCGQPLLRALEDNFVDLDPACYQHPLDAEALEKLQRLPGIKTLLRRVIKLTVELNLRLSQAATTVQVSERQMPEIYKRFRYAAERLGVDPLPELFVVQNPFPNASTFGVDEYFVTVTTQALDLLDEEEQITLFAHELGHIHSDHMLYKTAARLVSSLATQLAAISFGIGGLIALPLQLALLWWDRCAELTADRAGLLVARRPEVALRLLMKMAGGTTSLYEQMSFEAFMEQADRLESMGRESGWARTLLLVQELFRTHPFPVYRAKEIVDWITTGNYLEILDGEVGHRDPEEAPTCPACHRVLAPSDIVCPACGADVKPGDTAGEGPDVTANIDGFFDEAMGAAGDALKGARSAMTDFLNNAGDWWKRSTEPRVDDDDDDDDEEPEPRK